VPGYEILGELGRGAVGVVYKARQVCLNRVVALKMVLDGGPTGNRGLARFQREAEAIAKLHHPNIVQIYEVGEASGRAYFSLEYCPGGSLADRLGGARPPAAEAAGLVEQLARAVHAAHAAGVVHRDLKPGNILLGADGTPKISDFGLAKRMDGHELRLTQSGTVIGTPNYMAPEQAAGRSKTVGPAADVWALGAILYELLTGRPPFRGASVWETVAKVVRDEPEPPGQLRPDTPSDLEAVCLKCLRKDPAGRYATALELAEELGRCRAGLPANVTPRADRLTAIKAQLEGLLRSGEGGEGGRGRGPLTEGSLDMVLTILLGLVDEVRELRARLTKHPSPETIDHSPERDDKLETP
jgi:serine/threonine-protein kinase